MTAASRELCDTRADVGKLATVFAGSMTTLCGIWQQCATKVQAKYYQGTSLVLNINWFRTSHRLGKGKKLKFISVYC